MSESDNLDPLLIRAIQGAQAFMLTEQSPMAAGPAIGFVIAVPITDGCWLVKLVTEGDPVVAHAQGDVVDIIASAAAKENLGPFDITLIA